MFFSYAVGLIIAGLSDESLKAHLKYRGISDDEISDLKEALGPFIKIFYTKEEY